MPSVVRAPSGPPAAPSGENVDEFFQLLEQQVPFPAPDLEQLVPAALLQHWNDQLVRRRAWHGLGSCCANFALSFS